MLVIIQISINRINKNLAIDWTEKYNARLQKLENKVPVNYGDIYAYNSMKRCIITKNMKLELINMHMKL